MNLPDGFNSRKAFESFHGFVLSSFVGTIVHDHDTRMQRPEEHGIIAEIQSMMVDLKKIHGSRTIDWANQVFFHPLCQISPIKERELPICQHQDNALGVIGVILGNFLFAGTDRV